MVITSGSSTINLADVVGGNVTLTIVNGLVTKIELNGGSAATGELAGTVLFVNEDDRIVLLETTGGQADNRVSVSIPSSVKILTVAGKNMDLEDIELETHQLPGVRFLPRGNLRSHHGLGQIKRPEMKAKKRGVYLRAFFLQ